MRCLRISTETFSGYSSHGVEFCSGLLRPILSISLFSWSSVIHSIFRYSIICSSAKPILLASSTVPRYVFYLDRAVHVFKVIKKKFSYHP